MVYLLLVRKMMLLKTLVEKIAYQRLLKATQGKTKQFKKYAGKILTHNITRVAHPLLAIIVFRNLGKYGKTEVNDIRNLIEAYRKVVFS